MTHPASEHEGTQNKWRDLGIRLAEHIQEQKDEIRGSTISLQGLVSDLSAYAPEMTPVLRDLVGRQSFKALIPLALSETGNIQAMILIGEISLIYQEGVVERVRGIVAGFLGLPINKMRSEYETETEDASGARIRKKIHTSGHSQKAFSNKSNGGSLLANSHRERMGYNKQIVKPANTNEMAARQAKSYPEAFFAYTGIKRSDSYQTYFTQEYKQSIWNSSPGEMAMRIRGNIAEWPVAELQTGGYGLSISGHGYSFRSGCPMKYYDWDTFTEADIFPAEGWRLWYGGSWTSVKTNHLEIVVCDEREAAILYAIILEGMFYSRVISGRSTSDIQLKKAVPTMFLREEGLKESDWENGLPSGDAWEWADTWVKLKQGKA